MTAGRPGDWSLRHTGTELRTVARELRLQNDLVMTARFRRELRAAAAPLVPAVRASVRATPSKQAGPRSGSLRKAIARATTLRVRTAGRLASVAILVDGRKMPPREGALPAYYEGSRPRWRHPVYKSERNPDPPWVQEDPHPYFYRVVRILGLRSRYAIDRVLADTTRHITGRRIP